MNTHTDVTVKQESLVVKKHGEVIFRHNGSWLHPLIDLEKYLEETHMKAKDLFLQDKIVGRAAAFLIVDMGFKEVKALTLSLPGKEVFDAHSIHYEYETLVDRILCRTEQMLAETSDPLEARKLIDGLIRNPQHT